MEDTVQNLSKRISRLWEPDVRDRVNSILHVFLNRRSNNNRLLLLGLQRDEIVVNLLNSTVSDFIKDDARYWIKIVKSNKDCINISFDRILGLSPEKILEVKDMFNYYGCNSVDIDSSVEENRLPVLSIKNNLEWLKLNKHPALLWLMGQGMVDCFSINTTSRGSGKGLISSISEIDIIPQCNWLLAENSRESDETDNKPVTFWEYQYHSRSAIENPTCFNFVMLNSVDDHVIRIFTELMSLYKERYHIGEECISLLKRVFFISKGLNLESSRYKENCEESTIRIFDSLRNDIGILERDLCDIEAYSNILEIITSNNQKFFEQKDNTLSFVKDSKDRIDKIIRAVSCVCDGISDYQSLYEKASSLSYFDNDALLDRASFYASLRENLKGIRSFSDKYATDKLPLVEPLSDKCEKDEQRMCERKSLLKTYSVSKKEFYENVQQWKDSINSIIQTVTNSISVTDWDEISQKMNYAKNLLSVYRFHFSPNDMASIGLHSFVERYNNLVESIECKALDIFEKISHQSMQNGTITYHLSRLGKDISNEFRSNKSEIEKNMQLAIDQEMVEKYLRDKIRNMIVSLAE